VNLAVNSLPQDIQISGFPFYKKFRIAIQNFVTAHHRNHHSSENKINWNDV